jgi:uncharacterized protein (DUF1800 family)
MCRTHSVTVVVAAVTDSAAHMAATARTLEFAHLVRSVYNRPTITELPPSAELLALFSAELATLKEQLVHGVAVEPEEQSTDDLLAKMHAAGAVAAKEEEDAGAGFFSAEAAASSLLKLAAAQLTEEVRAAPPPAIRSCCIAALVRTCRTVAVSSSACVSLSWSPTRLPKVTTFRNLLHRWYGSLTSVCSGGGGGKAIKKLRIVMLRFGTAGQKMVLE